MKIKFNMPWHQFIPEQVVDSIPDGAANLLIARGIASEFKEQPKQQIQGKPKRQ